MLKFGCEAKETLHLWKLMLQGKVIYDDDNKWVSDNDVEIHDFIVLRYTSPKILKNQIYLLYRICKHHNNPHKTYFRSICNFINKKYGKKSWANKKKVKKCDIIFTPEFILDVNK